MKEWKELITEIDEIHKKAHDKVLWAIDNHSFTYADSAIEIMNKALDLRFKIWDYHLSKIVDTTDDLKIKKYI